MLVGVEPEATLFFLNKWLQKIIMEQNSYYTFLSEISVK